MEDIRKAIIEEARSWIGTPFRHQCNLKGVGVDCVGLILGVGEKFDFKIEPHLWEPYANYAKLPNPSKMKRALNQFMKQCFNKEEALVGDIMFLEWRHELPMHLAFLSELNGRKTLIHALSEIGKVVEHSYTELWQDRATSAWRYPFLEG
jgi:NlpC/P60 family putative phage cell wall peptidase